MLLGFNFLLLTFYLFLGCHSIRTAAPPKVSEIPQIIQKPSTIIIPVSIDIKDLERKVNNELNGLVYEDNSLDDNNHDNMMIKAWKRDYFDINLNGNEISYRLPLKLWVKAGFKLEKF